MGCVQPDFLVVKFLSLSQYGVVCLRRDGAMGLVIKSPSKVLTDLGAFNYFNVARVPILS